MITGRDFVITGLQPWDLTIGSNARDIAKEIAKNNRVLYVNAPIDTLTLWKNSSTKDIAHRKNVIQKRKRQYARWKKIYGLSIILSAYFPAISCQTVRFLMPSTG